MSLKFFHNKKRIICAILKFQEIKVKTFFGLYSYYKMLIEAYFQRDAWIFSMILLLIWQNKRNCSTKQILLLEFHKKQSRFFFFLNCKNQKALQYSHITLYTIVMLDRKKISTFTRKKPWFFSFGICTQIEGWFLQKGNFALETYRLEQSAVFIKNFNWEAINEKRNSRS